MTPAKREELRMALMSDLRARVEEEGGEPADGFATLAKENYTAAFAASKDAIGAVVQ